MNIIKIFTLILILVATATKSAIINPEISKKYFDDNTKGLLQRRRAGDPL